MLGLIEPLIKDTARKSKRAFFEEAMISPMVYKLQKNPAYNLQKTSLFIQLNRQPTKLSQTISPSLEKTVAPAQLGEVEVTNYSPGLALNDYKNVPANELGIWVHRLYQVYFMRPELISKALSMKPLRMRDRAEVSAVLDHLASFKSHLGRIIGRHSKFLSEVSVIGQNSDDQTISGIVDLIAFTDGGLWIIDHKSSATIESALFWQQLLEYRELSVGSIAAILLHWPRLSKCSHVAFDHQE